MASRYKTSPLELLDQLRVDKFIVQLESETLLSILQFYKRKMYFQISLAKQKRLLGKAMYLQTNILTNLYLLEELLGIKLESLYRRCFLTILKTC